MRRVSMSATAIKGKNGEFVRSRTVMHDITELSKARHELTLLHREQEGMLDNELVGIVKVRNRIATWTNRAFEQIFGYDDGELLGVQLRKLYFDEASFQAFGQEAYPAIAGSGSFRTVLRMRRNDGRPVWVDVSGALASPASDEVMWMLLDVTAAKEHSDRAEEVATLDALTGLANRLLLMDRLRQAVPLAGGRRTSSRCASWTFDGFKAVNDRLGHIAGDKMLQVIARRMAQCVRGHDTVARIGGDELSWC